jgi:hypothetical protein
MGLRRRGRALDPAQELDEAVVRDAEESLVASLQESDTAVEALRDDESDLTGRHRWQVGLAGVLLAVLGIMVVRRRS